jgi:hypothetical protein
MSIAAIGTEFKFVGAELVEHSDMRPLSDWRNGDPLQVVAHVKMYGSVSALYWNTRDLSSSTVRDDLLEEIPDARETAIREIMDIADVDCRVTAARLVDAGFKREVV